MRRGDARRKRYARGIPFWISGAAAAVLTFAVLVALVTLHEWSVQRQLASQSITTLRTAVAVEEESVLDSPSTTESRQDETDTALLLVEITEKSTPTLSAITHMAAAYQSAVSLEIAAVLRGDPQAASGLHIALGDPAFTALDAELATVGRAEASNAADGVTAAFIASIGIVSGSGVLILLFALYARRRRATVAADQGRAATLAAESRIATNREETFRSLFDENPQPMMVTSPAAAGHGGRQPAVPPCQQCGPRDVWVYASRIPHADACGDTTAGGSRSAEEQPARHAGRTYPLRGHPPLDQVARRPRCRDRYARNHLRRQERNGRVLERRHGPDQVAARAGASSLSRCADRLAESIALWRPSRTCPPTTGTRHRLLRRAHGGPGQLQDGQRRSRSRRRRRTAARGVAPACISHPRGRHGCTSWG